MDHLEHLTKLRAAIIREGATPQEADKMLLNVSNKDAFHILQPRRSLDEDDIDVSPITERNIAKVLQVYEDTLKNMKRESSEAWRLKHMLRAFRIDHPIFSDQQPSNVPIPEGYISSISATYITELIQAVLGVDMTDIILGSGIFP